MQDAEEQPEVIKLVVEVPAKALDLVRQDPEKYLGPLLVAFGASILAQIKSSQE